MTTEVKPTDLAFTSSPWTKILNIDSSCVGRRKQSKRGKSETGVERLSPVSKRVNREKEEREGKNGDKKDNLYTITVRINDEFHQKKAHFLRRPKGLIGIFLRTIYFFLYSGYDSHLVMKTRPN